jgi:hypothetical protein
LSESWTRFQAANFPAMLSTLLGWQPGSVRDDSQLRAPGLRRERIAVGRCCLQHARLGCTSDDGGEPDSGRLHSSEIRYYAGAAAASGRGGSSAAAEGFQRRFGGTVDRNDRRFRPARDSRAPATQRTLKRYALTAMSGIKDDINGTETKWIVQECPAR